MLIDPIDRTTVWPLVCRASQSAICVYIAFMSIKYFNVSTVGIVCSLKPIIVCIFAVLVMGEHMGALDVFSNAMSFSAILLVIVGSSGAEAQNMETCAWAFIALIMQPILLAGGDLLLKKMGKLPEEPVSFA